MEGKYGRKEAFRRYGVCLKPGIRGPVPAAGSVFRTENSPAAGKEEKKMTFHYQGLGHVALRAREKDLPVLERFLTETLEFPKAFELTNRYGEHWISYFRAAPGQYVEVIPGIPSSPCEYFDGTRPRCEHSHFHQCFQIGDRAKVLKILEGKGLSVERDPSDAPGMCGSHCMFVQDPFGTEWELMEFTPQSMQLLSDPDLKPDSERKHPFVKRLSHVTFCCKNYPEVVKFYTEVLGLPKAFTLPFTQNIIDGYTEKGYPIQAKPGDEWITYIRIASREFVELFNVPYRGENDTKNQEFHHFCLIVDDIFAAAAELEEKGVRLWHGPRWQGEDFKKPFAEEAVPGQCGSYAFFIQDPEGNEIEFMQYTEKSLQVLNDHD